MSREDGRLARSIRQISIYVTDQHGRATKFDLAPGGYLLGRGKNCHIQFPNSKSVSRQHAKLVVEPTRVTIEDLESQTGIMVNGKVCRSAELGSDDIVNIAKFTMRVELPDLEPEPVRGSSYVIGVDEDVAEAAHDFGAELDALKQTSDRLFREIAKRIFGQELIVRAVWASILARGHCLLVGVPGLAKTLLVSTFADALGLQSKRIQFTPDLLPSDIVGSNVIHEGEDGRRYFEFVQGPIFTQLLLADEINRTPPKTQAALLEAMQERQVTVGDKSLSLPEPFFVIATQNPIEQEGTYPLPEAQQDRFMLSLNLDYPGREHEIEIFIATTQGHSVSIDEVMTYDDILKFQEIVNQVVISRELAAYTADLVRATRPKGGESPDWLADLVDWGAGPRAGQALIRIAKALAAIDGRPAVARKDILSMLLPAMRHRIRCTFRARGQGMNEDAVIKRLGAEVRPPNSRTDAVPRGSAR